MKNQNINLDMKPGETSFSGANNELFVSGMILTAAEPEKSQKSRSSRGHNTETGGTGGTGQRHQSKGGQFVNMM